MPRSGRRDKAEGLLDKISGSMVRFSGKLTGNKTDKRQGRKTKLRGHLRSGKGRAKRAAGSR
jgi:uncharacterized protein YjbJ (UPF0337 family)